VTNPIGQNNALVGICLHKEVKAVLGKEALADDRSLANFIFAAAMAHWRAAKPHIAEQIQAIRENAGKAALLIVFLCGLLSTDQQFARRMMLRGARRRDDAPTRHLVADLAEPEFGDMDLRRSPRGRRVEQEEAA
jgi:hypothetical protein